jgi:hypothetical protein
MTTAIPQKVPGVASFESSDTYITNELFNSAIPDPVTEDFPVGASTTIEAYSVVGLDGSGNLAMAKTTATAVVPIGITTARIATGVGGSDRIAVYRAGNFNPDALVWHADYDTDAKKAAAFRISPAPTNIIIRKRL